jgi:hypothetical protein
MQQQAKEFIGKYSLMAVAADYPRGINKQYEELFNSIFGRLPNCSGCSKGRDDWKLLVQYSTTGILTTTKMSNSRFKLKENCMPYCASSHAYLMQKTLTDEAAVRFLAQSPALKKHFETLPDGWEQEVEDFKANGPAPKADVEVEVTEETSVTNEPATGDEVTTVTEETPEKEITVPAPEADQAPAPKKNPFNKKR